MTYPRIAIVSRRSVRKDKYIDYVGEFHLELIAKFKALPVIVPRIGDVIPLLDSLLPLHGLLLVEGEDVGPKTKKMMAENSDSDCDSVSTSSSLKDTIEDKLLKEQHSSDANPDENKDEIETYLIRKCLKENIPILAICRGSQLLNIINGGTVYSDIELKHKSEIKIQHMNYNNYDNHRHSIRINSNTPLYQWFNNQSEIQVNSYHHQGINKLAKRFYPMAFSEDNIIEGYYDPNFYDPEKGKFLLGLQFHPERMQNINLALHHSQAVFEHQGFIKPYEEFIIAAFAYQKLNKPYLSKGLLTQNNYKKRNHFIMPPNLNMTDEDIMSKIINSGASVHGVHILRDILQENQENNQIIENKLLTNNYLNQWGDRLDFNSIRMKRRLLL